MRAHENHPNKLPKLIGNSIFSDPARSPVKRASMASRRGRMLTSPKRARQKQPSTPLKPSMRFPLATEVVKPSTEWKPFFSCLIDTVAVVIDLRHKPLNRLAEDNHNVKRKGNFELRVHSKFSREINARVLSRDNGAKLYIEASIPKFSTGQNIVGMEELFLPCLSMINAVLEQMGIEPTVKERAKLNKGKFQMVRIDDAVHCDCGMPERAAAVMAALRSLVYAKAKDASAYGIETVYVQQHSSRWTLRIYRKDLEIEKPKRSLPAHVYGRKYLLEKVQNCVRLELVLRAPELKRLGLNDPLAWNVEAARQRMQVWIERLSTAGGVVPNIEHLSDLTRTEKMKLLLWLDGHRTVFTDSHSTFAATRKTILAKTGIDIRGESSVELQHRAMKTIREVLIRGTGFKSYAHKWVALCKGADAGNAKTDK